MQERRRSDYSRAILVFMVVVLSIGMIFQLRVGVDTHRLVAKIERSTHVDIAAQVAGLPDPFDPLDETCTRCHSERRYGGKQLSGEEVDQVIAQMNQHPDVGISRPQWERLHAALVMQRCLGCHDDVVIKEFLAMSPYQRHGLIDHMIHSSGSTITRTDSEEILSAAITLGSD
ncbi:MAG: hypothetical protein Q8O14_14110 [bacterium]|jgi:hypothetical protein|nr:hypothetical protein [bacterium]